MPDSVPTPADPDRIVDRLPFLLRRNLVRRGVRAFFDARGYVEVETPCAVPTPGEEVHLKVFRTERAGPDGVIQPLWLHTSPEFAMKRIVAATGLPVYQLARVWRNAEGSHLHAHEFTMLEWYRPGATLSALMDETEALLRVVLPPVVRRAAPKSVLRPRSRGCRSRMPFTVMPGWIFWRPKGTRQPWPAPQGARCVQARRGRTCSSG